MKIIFIYRFLIFNLSILFSFSTFAFDVVRCTITCNAAPPAAATQLQLMIGGFGKTDALGGDTGGCNILDGASSKTRQSDWREFCRNATCLQECPKLRNQSFTYFDLCQVNIPNSTYAGVVTCQYKSLGLPIIGKAPTVTKWAELRTENDINLTTRARLTPAAPPAPLALEDDLTQSFALPTSNPFHRPSDVNVGFDVDGVLHTNVNYGGGTGHPISELFSNPGRNTRVRSEVTQMLGHRNTPYIVTHNGAFCLPANLARREPFLTSNGFTGNLPTDHISCERGAKSTIINSNKIRVFYDDVQAYF